MNDWAHYEAGSHKLLSDNRRLYIDQSARTVTGRAADFGEQYAREQSPVSDDELREGFAMKYGS